MTGHQDEMIITIKWGWPWREAEYIGSCTVWYKLPKFKRQGTFTEGTLAGLWTMAKYKERQNAST